MASFSSGDETLDIAVIGAGIAGLAAGICLRRAGHAVTIYERSEFKNEVGAAITMTPHAVRILRAWGIANPEPVNDESYSDSAHGKKLHGSMYRDPKTGDVMGANTFIGDEEIYGARTTTYHRADLHDALRRAATEAGTKIVLGQTAVAIDCEAGAATLTDTATKSKTLSIKANIIVLADGHRSAFVQAVTQQDIPPVPLDLQAYRMLVPVEDLLADSEAAMLFRGEGQHCAASTRSRDTGVFIITYPCRDGELMNVAIFSKPKNVQNHSLDWGTEANVADAEAALHGFHPAYRAILRYVHSVKVYLLWERAPLPTYVNGRVVLIGDAAHPMLPTVAGGGTTSLEDAAALEVLLRGLGPPDSEQLTQRLALFDALRRPRDSVTQIISKYLINHTPIIELADQIRHLYTGHLPEVPIAGSSKDTKEFVYHYDVYEVTKAALAWAEKEGYPKDMLLRLQEEGVVKHFGK